MLIFYFDSSGLAKGYVREKGSAIVTYILKNTPAISWHVLMLGLLETISIFVRKKNNGTISSSIFTASLQALRKDFFDNANVFKVESTNDLALEASPLIEKYSINATDAVVLRSALDIAAFERKQSNELILVTSDQRLVTAAIAEGLHVINPETATLVEIEKLLQPEPPPAQSAE
ncbi:MAG: type II toxin-antitoxin system VapC family toxin [candidate division KSB1 bacterium]|nr:type II toxin-antitoxin system VapC family toxin [candidate division KSB1 bacterium]MDZ7300786.1 type II toxin-antitoxin system VapC family toxin [candidate division KSB1 bacterium]MDZ7309943.1 type II toxin-antitoxin system VapC family toxin [candidate division KSB1 bacterium]